MEPDLSVQTLFIIYLICLQLILDFLQMQDLTEQYLPKAKMTPVEATYLAWLDMRAYGKTCDEMGKMCKEGGVALTSGTFFGPEGEGFMRVNFACPRAMLTEGMRRLGRIFEEE